jgi:hypothetical protein
MASLTQGVRQRKKRVFYYRQWQSTSREQAAFIFPERLSETGSR